MQRSDANLFYDYCYLIGDARNGFRKMVTKTQTRRQIHCLQF